MSFASNSVKWLIFGTWVLNKTLTQGGVKQINDEAYHHSSAQVICNGLRCVINIILFLSHSSCEIKGLRVYIED
jgi:hypothetical protein